MRSYFVLISVLLTTACVSSGPVYSGRVSTGNENVQVDVVFSNADRSVIREYYAGQGRKGKKSMPPGLAKKDRLPPGLEKQLQRRGTLPAGLQRQPLPHTLESRLTSLPSDYVRVRVDHDIVLLDSRTNVIMDVIYDLGQ